MLQLNNIVKTYFVGDQQIPALKGVSLRFRRNEFVSVLGPSGCGKTTLLNLIGGLDGYTDGDLIIDGRSTKGFGDRDWDAYRNHTIGFVFQSYNLIPHQTVLQNVELALTLSGVNKKERRRRAKEALQRVGLGDQLKKRPGQMSGGQMQRVAIARALVTNPAVILADEPTGALDTETSVQIMDLLKEVAQDRLVIMVTHNPDLAETYSTRIIRMLDGQVQGDSAPLTEAEIAEEERLEQEKNAACKKRKMPAMSLATSCGLSLKNLFTKKGRTLLTSFAGSIGIIGIALIFAVSQGTTMYINTVQEDTLASYPLTLEATHTDIGSLLETFVGAANSSQSHEKDAVYQKNAVYDLVNSLNTLKEEENDLRTFKKYLEEHRHDTEDETGLGKAISGVQYSYDLDLQVYSQSVDDTILRSDSSELMQELIAEFMGMDTAALTAQNGNMGNFSMMGNMGSRSTWQEMLSGDGDALISPLLKKQYDVIAGRWPNAYNEVVLVVDENNELDDMSLYALGLKSKEEIDDIMDAAMNKTTVETVYHTWTYDEIMAMDFRVVLGADCFTEDEETGLFTDLRETETGLKYLYDNGIPLKVTGILRPNEEAVSTMLGGAIGYTKALTEYVINHAQESPAVKAQMESPDTDVLTGLPFAAEEELTDEEKTAVFRGRVEAMTRKEQAEMYVTLAGTPDEKTVEQTVNAMMMGQNRQTMEATLLGALTQQMGMKAETVQGYLQGMSDDELKKTFTDMVRKQVEAQFAAQTQAQLAAVPESQLASQMKQLAKKCSAKKGAEYYDTLLTFSESTYDENLLTLGCVDLESPTTINLYAATFASKDKIEDAIADYNDSVDELYKIAYTDYVGIMMSSVTTIIDAITYVLIAFVGISLVVSSIMIGVITLISVQERTKEIGILRAIGASKRNVSSLFNAETVLIGLASGILGIAVTYGLCIPLNMLVHYLTGINNLSAYLPPRVAVILVGISMLLTLIAGIIPSRSAAKKDPVVALRTE